MTNLTTLLRTLAWAWVIVIGGLIITPGGINCTVCGPLLNQLLGIMSILIGLSGLVADVRERSVSG